MSRGPAPGERPSVRQPGPSERATTCLPNAHFLAIGRCPVGTLAIQTVANVHPESSHD